jgi:predicted O-methyltransferase YrrM
MLLSKNKRLRQIAALAETSNLLFFKLLFAGRRGAREYPGVVYREYLARAGKDIWRSASIFDLLPDLREKPQRIVLEHLPGQGIHDAVDELAYLALITRSIAPMLVFEIGTFRGRTALNFAINSPDACRVLTLDLPLEGVDTEHLDPADRALARSRQVGHQYEGKDVSHKIQQLYGDSRTFDFSPYEGHADIVFIDGGHTYEIARSDTENALRICRPGGVILWHDFGNYGDYADVVRGVLDCVPADDVYQIDSTQLAFYRRP